VRPDYRRVSRAITVRAAGTLDMTSAPGAGTTISGRLPVGLDETPRERSG
jgi:hypothetical protein